MVSVIQTTLFCLSVNAVITTGAISRRCENNVQKNFVRLHLTVTFTFVRLPVFLGKLFVIVIEGSGR